MKISEVSLDIIKSYIGLTEDDVYDENLFKLFMDDAKFNIMDYTGLDEIEVNFEKGLAKVYLCLISEMYNNRSMTTTTKNNVNEIMIKILNLHDYNW